MHHVDNPVEIEEGWQGQGHKQPTGKACQSRPTPKEGVPLAKETGRASHKEVGPGASEGGGQTAKKEDGPGASEEGGQLAKSEEGPGASEGGGPTAKKEEGPGAKEVG